MAGSAAERLPVNVWPSHYNLTLEPDMERFIFQGKVEIRVNVLQNTDSITLHAGDLSIQSVRISDYQIPLERLSRDKDKETITIHLQGPITAGATVAFSICFNGALNDKLAGFFRSSYKDTNDKLRYLAVTQMQPTDARHVFPCFDEPAFKATFAITLIAKKEFVCLSNMDVKSEKVTQDGRKEVQFNNSPPMSTYIVAIVVGELAVIQTDVYHVPIRLYAVAGTDVERLGKFTLDLTARTLSFYDQHFDAPFPLPKMDIVAVPDFIGAMENWGLVIYRERDLLLEPSNIPIASLQRIVNLVQHELAHQWFGNLVTMEFWDDLWLNEGFATWMAWYACDAFFPEWKIWQIYTSEDLQHGLALDGMRSSHPVRVPIQSDSEIKQIFDKISYAKGACVLQMIASAIGHEIFLRGIRAYIRKYQYGNARSEDLWSVLRDVSGNDIGKMMRIWTEKVGYPVLFVTEDQMGDAIHVRQARFLIEIEPQPGDDETVYPLSLGLRTNTGVNTNAMLTTREAKFPVDDLDFFKINANHTGFYRTAYSIRRLEKLGEAATRGLLPVEDRIGLIADASALATAGHQRTSDVLSLLTMFSKEPEYIVWTRMLASFSEIGAAWMHYPEIREDLQACERQLIRTKAYKFDWAAETTKGNGLTRVDTLLFSTMALIGDPETQKLASEMFMRYCDGDRSAIHPDLRAAVFASVVQKGLETEYNAVLNIYDTTEDGIERITALAALGYAHDPALVQRTISMLLSDEVRLQDIKYPIMSLSTHPSGIAAVWQWIKQNWPTIKDRLSSGLIILPSVVRLCTKGLSTKEQLQQLVSFFESKETKGIDKALQQSLDEIRMKVRWVERDSENVYKWLKSYLSEA